MAAYKHTNSRGVVYYLHSKEVTLKGNRKVTIYFFAKEEKPEGGCASVPADRVVMENVTTGLPFLKKK